MLYKLAIAYLDAKAAGAETVAHEAYCAYLRAARRLNVDAVEYMMSARRFWKALQAA